MRLDALGSWLAVEVRDADLLQARFYTLQLATGFVTELKLPDHNTWWLGLEEAHAAQLYLHGYGDRKLGQHKGIRAIACDTGMQLWEQADQALYGVAEAGLLAYDPLHLTGKLQVLDSRNGKAVLNDIPQIQAAEWVQRFQEVRQQGVLYPQLYLQGEAYFAQVRDFLAQQLDCEAVKAIEYAETATSVVVSYYLQNNQNKLDNYLAVFDLNGFSHLNELLAGAIDGVGSDTFFIFMRKLYFVQNKASVTAYSL